jgi:hypothetical protein
VKVQ